jgi:antitoxin (DNA-binding transcriptional repressor) of toxin-antitoxin stability system
MRDHPPSRRGAAKQVVGIRELKTHAAGIVRHVREARASYILTHRGRAVGMILPLEPAEGSASTSEDAAAAWDAFIRAGRRLERRFRPDVGGVRLLSAMRR